MEEERFIELEVKLAYQEDTLKALDNVVCRQQDSIDRLEQTCSYLMQRLREVTQNAPLEELDQEKPPHY